MPRKTLKQRTEKINPSDTKQNRVRKVIDRLVGNEDPDDIMIEIIEVLEEVKEPPSVGNYYTFVYRPKTIGIQYDQNPLVAVTDVFQWGFRGLNFHWGEVRQYTWNEVVGSLYLVNQEEIRDLRSIPYGKILNN
jgi:F420-0:gamma-glutamyl ligase-like protein